MELGISSVQTANIHILKSDPPKIIVEASGTVNTLGWTNGRLIPVVYFVPPDDGIQDFNFIGTAPDGYANQAQEENFKGTGWIPQFDWLKGVRIIAASNSIEVMLSGATEADPGVGFVQIAGDEHWPFPH